MRFHTVIGKSEAQKAIELLQEYFKQQQNTIERLHSTINNFNGDERVKEAEIQLLQLRHNSLCILSDSEREKVNKWHASHKETGCKGKYYEYILSPTGIGMGITMRCKRCGYTENINDDF